MQSPALLNASAAHEMLTPLLDSSDAALGVFVKEKGGEKYFTHSGVNLGFRDDYYASVSTGVGVVVLTNSDNGQSLIDEVINSVAVVYNWKAFYQPKVKKLVNIPVAIIDKYVGEYISETPKLKISIVNKDGILELTARQSERMFATSDNTFFLMSSPSQECVFSSSRNDDFIDTFEVKQGKETVIRATKQQKTITNH